MEASWQHVPTCPFCGSAWSEAMIEQYDRMSAGNACSCCGPADHTRHQVVESVAAVPVSDLCCATCGRAIYRAPVSLGD